MSLSKMDRWTAKQMLDSGYSVNDVAYALDVTERTVSRALSGETGAMQDTVADRMEYFIGGATANSGCFHNGELLEEESDPTAEAVDWERFVEKLSENESF